MSWIPPLKQPIDRQHIIMIASFFVKAIVRLVAYGRLHTRECTLDRFLTRLHKSPFQKSKAFWKTNEISSEYQNSKTVLTLEEPIQFVCFLNLIACVQ